MNNELLIAPYSDQEKEKLRTIFKQYPYTMLEILNTYHTAKTFENVELILSTASKLGIDPMCIYSLMWEPLNHE